MVRTAEGRSIAEGNGYIPLGSLYLRLGKESVFHLREHTRDAFSLFAGETKIYQHSHDAWIAALVNAFKPEQFFQGDAANQRARADHLDTVVEHADFRAGSHDSVVTMSDGVEQCLAPSKFRILRTFLETIAHQPGGTSQHTANGVADFRNNRVQVALTAGAFFNVVLGSSAAFGTNDAEQADAGVGVFRVVAGEQQLGSVAQYQIAATTISQPALDQILLVGQPGQAGILPRQFQQFGIQVGQSARGLPAFPTGYHSLKL